MRLAFLIAPCASEVAGVVSPVCVPGAALVLLPLCVVGLVAAVYVLIRGFRGKRGTKT